ncbi:hypothetical protein PZB74_01940 [Porifericola rhodea]|uniref:hypothetical protein n=1 Tax=Porifericola rhodea TaxID=930972 RepID=UPI0026651ABE|nr:hypothetical protein [Porifericola rhodea]WKN32113.1 hypothetical protein PZB74_01940 [Porifericola rhodea]
MRYRGYNSDLVSSQENLRILLLKNFFSFDISKVGEVLAQEEAIKLELSKLIKGTKESSDEGFFKYYGYFVSSLFHLLKWAQKEMNAEDGMNHLKASATHIKQIDFEYFNYIPDFRDSFQELCESIKRISEVTEVKGVLIAFTKLSFPAIFTFTIDPFQEMRGDHNAQAQSQEDAKIIMLSLQFTIDGEPWANPQILKPEELYTIKGKLTINEWPEGFDTLNLKPVSTSSNDWFNLSIPQIRKEAKKEYNVTGHIVFKYPQNTFDELISIRILGYFQNSIGKKEYPTVIGYDQLILKVLDPNSNYFLTGFKKMNKVVLDIANTINRELPEIEKEEKEDFLNLLSGILNYQGFCLQQGVYKGQNKVLEDDFRDRLIQHLIGLPYLGEEISKEAHLAGGRIEIGYRGLIAELKVEYNISDRDKLFEKYGKQPVAYASGNSKQLAILCILDLTEKNLPPATPQNSIRLLKPKVHGFEDKEVDHPSRLVMIVIDGNTKKPSHYSR